MTSSARSPSSVARLPPRPTNCYLRRPAQGMLMAKTHSPSDDLRGLSRLTIAAIVGVTELVEAVHLNILQNSGKLGVPMHKPLSGTTGWVYRRIRGITNLVGVGIDTLLGRLTPLLGERSAWPGREALLAALNGVLGDYLAGSNNPLAIRMCLR